MIIAVVIRTTDGLWSMTRFRNPTAAEWFIELAQDELDNIKDINLVGCSYDTFQKPPEGYSPKPGADLYWCPACGEERHFFKDPDTSYKLCEICHVSDALPDFKTYNHTWESTTDIKAKKKKKKEEFLS